MAAFALASSPLSDAPSSHHSTSPSSQPTATTTTPSQQMIRSWRPAKELSFELQQYVRIYFEESLFTKAFDLLLAIVTSDAATSSSSSSLSTARGKSASSTGSSSSSSVTVPPPEHLALAATLIVHPWVTTRTTSEEKWSEATAALRLLRLLLKLAGPVNAGFGQAFQFRKFYGVATTATEEEENTVKHPFAHEDSIWSRADDFWAVVGWALNCSVLSGMYAARWEHCWQPWLEFVVDVLEADWRYHSTQNSPGRSMAFRYVTSSVPGEVVQPRRIVRAIFVDGSKSALNEFHAVFRRELKGPKDRRAQEQRKREAIDIDREIYGDYLVQDDSYDSSEEGNGNERPLTTVLSKRTSTRNAAAQNKNDGNNSSRRITPRTSRQSLRSEDIDNDDESEFLSHSPGLGPPGSVAVRLRLMQLLVHVSSQRGNLCTSSDLLDTIDLFTLFVEFIKPLPLAAFQQIVSNALLDPDTQILLVEHLLHRLLENTSVSHHRSSTTAAVEEIQQRRILVLIEDFLPHAANRSSSIDAQARVSLCLEVLLRNWTKSVSTIVLSDNDEMLLQEMSRAVESGIERRTAKVRDKIERVKKKNSRGEGEEEEEAAVGWLLESSNRLRDIVWRFGQRQRQRQQRKTVGE